MSQNGIHSVRNGVNSVLLWLRPQAALRRKDPLLLLDDAAARTQAKALGIRFTGTLGVLVKAQHAGHITTVRPYLDQWDEAGLYLRPNVRALVLRLAGETN